MNDKKNKTNEEINNKEPKKAKLITENSILLSNLKKSISSPPPTTNKSVSMVEYVKNSNIFTFLYNNITQVVPGTNHNPNVKYIKLLKVSEENQTQLEHLKTLLETAKKAANILNLENKEKKLAILKNINTALIELEEIIPKSNESHFEIYGYPDLLKGIFIKSFSIKSTRNSSSNTDRRKSENVEEEHIILTKMNTNYFNTITQTFVSNEDIPNIGSIDSLKAIPDFTSTLDCGIPLSKFISDAKDTKGSDDYTFQMWSLFLQLAHQILYFGEHHNFINNDLHLKNIVVSYEKTDFVLSIVAKQGKLPYPKCTVYFKNCYKFTIVDHGVLVSLPNDHFTSSIFPLSFKNSTLSEIISQCFKKFNFDTQKGILSFFSLASYGSGTKTTFSDSEIFVDQFQYNNDSFLNPDFTNSLQKKSMDRQDFKYFPYIEIDNSNILTTVSPDVTMSDSFDFHKIKLILKENQDNKIPFQKVVWPSVVPSTAQKTINNLAYKVLSTPLVPDEIQMICFFIKYSNHSEFLLNHITQNSFSSDIYLNGSYLYLNHASKLQENINSPENIYQSIKSYLNNYYIFISSSTIFTLRDRLIKNGMLLSQHQINSNNEIYNAPSKYECFTLKYPGVDIFNLIYDDLLGDLYCNASLSSPQSLGVYCRKKIFKNTLITQFYPSHNVNYNYLNIKYKPLPVQFFGCGNLITATMSQANCRLVDDCEIDNIAHVLIKSKNYITPVKFVIATQDIEPNQELILYSY